MYKLTKDNGFVIRLSDNAIIPFDLGNEDYAAYQRWLSTGNTPQPVSLLNISDSKSAKQREIANAADTFLSSMAQEYGAYEKLTWDQQALEADALLADAESPAPLVRAIAQARGMTALEMAQRIAANRAQWVALSGAVVGKRLAYQDALDAAQTVEEVNAIKPVFP